MRHPSLKYRIFFGIFPRPILANIFFLIQRYVKYIKSVEKPLRAILLNFDGFFTFNYRTILYYIKSYWVYCIYNTDLKLPINITMLDLGKNYRQSQCQACSYTSMSYTVCSTVVEIKDNAVFFKGGIFVFVVFIF